MSQFSVDSKSPEVAILVAPSPLQAGGTAKFAFESTEPAITFQCALLRSGKVPSSRDWRACTSPKVYTSLADGKYTFYLSGVDDVGNNAIAKEHAFQVDGSSPVIRSVSVPSPSNSTDAQVVFTVDDGANGSGVDNVQCRLATLCIGPSDCDESRLVAPTDGGTIGHDWQTCGERACRRCDDGTLASTGQYVPCLRCTVDYTLVEGRFHFSVLAFDRTLNSNTPTNYTLLVDKSPPMGAVRSGPSQEDPVPSSVRFTFDLLDGGPGGSNVTQTLCLLRPEGMDLQSPASQDQEQPSFNGVGTRTREDVSATSAAFQLVESVNIQGVGETPLGDWVPCTQPVIYSGLSGGPFEFLLVPVDAAGNRGPMSKPYPFTVDPTLPIPSFFAEPVAGPGSADGGSSGREGAPLAPSSGAQSSGPAAASPLLVIGISVVIALVAAAIIVGLILWSRRRHRRRERYAENGQVGDPAGQYSLNGQAPPGAGWPSGAASGSPYDAATAAGSRRSQEEEEAMRRAIQASLEDEQVAAALQASMHAAREQRALQQSIASAELEAFQRSLHDEDVLSPELLSSLEELDSSAAGNSSYSFSAGDIRGGIELPPRHTPPY
mmetsp:Transcript_14428/g.40716  ORF Transcript_14428/g.40716 Transcript_14428/m.40716 type:complete len:605 (+) Transcript_14428:275-2089(+)